MDSVVLENQDEQFIIKLDKKVFDKDYLINLVKRINTENIARNSGTDDRVINLAEEIKKSWWDKNGEEFLKGID